MLGAPVLAALRMIGREGLRVSGRWLALVAALLLLERVRWWARVRARRSDERWTARSSAEGGSPKMKNFMKKKMRRAMESWPRRKPWVNERLEGQPTGQQARVKDVAGRRKGSWRDVRGALGDWRGGRRRLT